MPLLQVPDENMDRTINITYLFEKSLVERVALRDSEGCHQQTSSRIHEEHRGLDSRVVTRVRSTARYDLSTMVHVAGAFFPKL